MYTRGFTLIELMVTISLVAILAAIAVPSFQTLILNNRMATQSNDFLSSLQLARSEAVKRGATVSLCKSANAASCTTAGTYAQGWIVFADTDSDSIVDAGEAVIQAYGPVAGGSTLTGSGTVANAITYTARGFTSLTADATVSLCPPSPAAVAGRDIQITASGRARIQNPPATACS